MTNSSIAVVPVKTTHEAIQFEDGTLVAVELAEPRGRFAVIRRDNGTIEIITMRDAEAEAVDVAKRLVEQLELSSDEFAARTLQ